MINSLILSCCFPPLLYKMTSPQNVTLYQVRFQEKSGAGFTKKHQKNNDDWGHHCVIESSTACSCRKCCAVIEKEHLIKRAFRRVLNVCGKLLRSYQLISSSNSSADQNSFGKTDISSLCFRMILTGSIVLSYTCRISQISIKADIFESDL